MKNNQRVVIFAVIVVFMVSVFGSAIFILADQDSQEEQLQTAAELQAQSDEIAQAQELQDQLDQEAAACAVQPITELANPDLTLPEYEAKPGPFAELERIDIVEGTGAVAEAGDCVIAQYHGTLTDGTVFDGTYTGDGAGTPLRFSLLRVIEGWQDGVPGMKEGGVRVLNIPSAQAYGPTGSPPVIGPDEDLTFVIELIQVVEI